MFAFSVTCQVSIGMTLWVVGSLPSRHDLQEARRPGGLAPPGSRPAHAAEAVPLQIHRTVLGSHWSIHPVNHGTMHEVTKQNRLFIFDILALQMTLVN